MKGIMILITMWFGTVLLNCQVTEDTISVGEYGYLVFSGRAFNPDFYNVQKDVRLNSIRSIDGYLNSQDAYPERTIEYIAFYYKGKFFCRINVELYYYTPRSSNIELVPVNNNELKVFEENCFYLKLGGGTDGEPEYYIYKLGYRCGVKLMEIGLLDYDYHNIKELYGFSE